MPLSRTDVSISSTASFCTSRARTDPGRPLWHHKSGITPQPLPRSAQRAFAFGMEKSASSSVSVLKP